MDKKTPKKKDTNPKLFKPQPASAPRGDRQVAKTAWNPQGRRFDSRMNPL